MRRREIKRDTSAHFYCTEVGLSETATGGVLQKKLVLKLSIFTGKHLCWGLFLKNLQGFRPATFFKRDSNTGVSCGRLFFGCFDGSLLHGPKVSRSR